MATPQDDSEFRQGVIGGEIPSSSSRGPSLVSADHPLDRGAVAVCRWRTARYHDNECSRYFDCPTHVVERALSDAGEPSGGQGEEGVEHDGGNQEHIEEEDAQSTGSQTHLGPGEVSPLSAGDQEGAGHQQARSPSPESRPETSGGANTTSPASRINERGARRNETRATGPSNGPSAGNTSPSYGRPWPEPASRAPSGRPAAPPLGFMRRDTGVSGPQVSTPSASRPPAVSTAPAQQPPQEVVLPRWQPDSEQTYCPICGTQFSIFVRKHHCRKCGRVVCNACSPHRITIPHRYIVRPPGAPHPLSQGPSLSLLDSQGWYPEFSGGERVRLCNPCVPDPNTAPPQSQAHQQSSQNGLAPLGRADRSSSDRWSSYFGAGGSNDTTHMRSRSATFQSGQSSSSQPPAAPPPRNHQSRILWGSPPASFRPLATSQSGPFYSGTGSRYRSMLDVGDRAGPSTIAGPSSSSSASRHFHSPVPRRPPIPEEDECPVCHRELPPRTLPNFESLREAHIASCIESHSRYGGRPPPSSGGSGGDGGGPDEARPPPRRTGMFPYTATEKDCVDSAECSICLEEFEVGVAMARLECLCRFHRACIDAWWERHPGRCPMHQHDGFGY